MVDISYLTFAINLILNLTGSKQYIDNVFILIVRIVLSHIVFYSVKLDLFLKKKKKLIKQRLISSNELLSFSTHGTAYCFFDAHLKC